DVEHQHLALSGYQVADEVAGKVAAAVEMGADVTQAVTVRYIRVDKNIGDLLLLADAGKTDGFLDKRRSQQNAVHTAFQDQLRLFYERCLVVLVEEIFFDLDTELADLCFGLLDAVQRGFPV